MEISNINELINLTYQSYNENKGTVKYGDCLLNLLKKHHYWPNIKIKKFKNDDNLVLIHNSYIKNNIENYKELYEQCRSVVLDFSKSIGNNVVITYSYSIPERYNVLYYLSKLYNQNDICRMSLDGTIITFYYHNNSWHCGTTSCPDINSSKYSHPTKTHGMMLNEVLYEYYKSVLAINDPDIIIKMRTLFTNSLNPLYSYDFILVHHENKHIIDYTNELGNNYKKLYHINTKNRITLSEENIDNKPLSYLGVEYIEKFINPEEAIKYLTTNNNCYGFIVKKENNKLYKITNEEILKREEIDPCNHNIWYNILYVFLLNRPDYNINDYIRTYIKDFEYPVDSNGVIIDPTYLIHTTINVIKDILYNLYISTTKYYTKYNRFKMDKIMDSQLNPIIRYHLAQLRHDQTTIYKGKIINLDNIYYYLCNNNIKNIKKLVKLFTTDNIYDIPENKLILFNLLNKLLEN